MPAKSEKQQNFFRMVKGVQSGEIPEKDVSDRVKKVASSMKPDDVDDFVEEGKLEEVYSDIQQRIRSSVPRQVWNVKQTSWDSVKGFEEEGYKIDNNLYQAITKLIKQDGVSPLPAYPTANFLQEPPGPLFVGKTREGDFYLINTEGYNYARYAVKLPDSFRIDTKYADLFDEQTLSGMYESLKKQYSNKH